MKLPLVSFLALCGPLWAGELKFETKTKEIDAPVDAKAVTADFAFKNESGEDVEIARYDAACSCINASISGGKLIYKSGESGVIRAAFDLSAVSGTVDKSVGVWLKGDPEAKPSIVLNTRVNIPVLVEVEPKTLFWNTGEEATPKTVTLTMKHDKPIKVISMSGADTRFKQELKTIEEGKKYEVTVTPLGTDKVAMGVIHIETDCKVQRHRSQRIFSVVRNQPKAPAPEAAAVTKP